MIKESGETTTVNDGDERYDKWIEKTTMQMVLTSMLEEIEAYRERQLYSKGIAMEISYDGKVNISSTGQKAVTYDLIMTGRSNFNTLVSP